MSLEAELKKFELSSVFTINFSWLKRYVESDNGMYTPMKNISDDEFREIENSFYALQATWKAWREAKAQAVPEGFVVASTKDLNIIYDQINDWNTDWPLVFGLFNRILEAREPTND